ncbi:hypothetical protein RCM47_24350 [Escherichia coli]|nr:hypothetical protein [Escherichia coli]
MLIIEQSKKRISKGLSLIEASMVLALSAIVVSGVLYYYNVASNNRKLLEDSKSIQMIISTVRSLYINQPQGVDVDVNAVIKAGDFDSVQNGFYNYTGIKLPTGDAVYLYSGGTKHGGKMFSLELATYSQDVCTYISPLKLGSSHIGTEVIAQGASPTVTDFTAFMQEDDSVRFLTPDRASEECATALDTGKFARVKMYMKD